MKKILFLAGLTILVVVLFKILNSPYHPSKKIIIHKDITQPEKAVDISPKAKAVQKRLLSKSECVKLAYDIQAFIMRIRLNPHSLTPSECKKMRGFLTLKHAEQLSDNKCSKTIKQHQKEVLVACH